MLAICSFVASMAEGNSSCFLGISSRNVGTLHVIDLHMEVVLLILLASFSECGFEFGH